MSFTELPKIYDFPPLYTKQPNALVFNKQLETWSNIILQYCQANKIFRMNDQRLRMDLFDNKKINRSVSLDLEKKIWDHVFQAQSRIVYLKEDPSTSASSCRKIQIDKNPIKKAEYGIVLWKSIEDWGSIVLNYMVNSANGSNSIFTLYELENQSYNELFHNIDHELLKYVVQEELCKNRKRVVLMYEEDPEEDQYGELVGIKLV